MMTYLIKIVMRRHLVAKPLEHAHCHTRSSASYPECSIILKWHRCGEILQPSNTRLAPGRRPIYLQNLPNSLLEVLAKVIVIPLWYDDTHPQKPLLLGHAPSAAMHLDCALKNLRR
jgi:hypothetical protein